MVSVWDLTAIWVDLPKATDLAGDDCVFGQFQVASINANINLKTMAGANNE
jgi:hypothetical protein